MDKKGTNVAVKYTGDIDPRSLRIDICEVKDRTVTAVHPSDAAKQTDTNVTGNFVVIDLEVQSALFEDSYAGDGRMQGLTVIDTAAAVQKKDTKTLKGGVRKGQMRNIPPRQERAASWETMPSSRLTSQDLRTTTSTMIRPHM